MQQTRVQAPYQTTNESLQAIMAGLDISSADSVLTICGSGDQAFALVERARSVLAVDYKPRQVEYVCNRAEALKVGNLEEFFAAKARDNIEEWELEDRRNYFTQEGRLERIRARLSSLTIARSDVFSVSGEFTKVYLSNVLEHSDHWPLWSRLMHVRRLTRLVGRMVPQGLIYVANSCSSSVGNGSSYLQELFGNGPRPKLRLDERLTATAQELEHAWVANVFRRMA